MDENHEILIRKPNKAFIKVLLKNKLIYKISSSLYLSYIKFHIEIDDVYKSDKINRLYAKSYDEIPYKANVFDYKLSSSFLRDPMANFVKSDDIFACTKPRNGDLKKYKLKSKFGEIDKDFLEIYFMFWMASAEEIREVLEKTENNLLDSISTEKTLGTQKRLTKNFLNQLKEAGLDMEDGFKILNHVENAMDKEHLTVYSYYARVKYLLNHFGEVEKEIGEIPQDVLECPFCCEAIPEFFNSCTNCGLHVREVDIEKYALLKNFTFKKFAKALIKSKIPSFLRR